MAEREETNRAREVYRTFCSAFDTKNWEYKKSDRKRQLCFPVVINGTATDFTVTVDAERQLVRLVATLPEKVRIEKIVDALSALCEANCKMADGSFGLDLSDGTVTYTMAALFLNSKIGEAFIGNLISFAIACIKKYSSEILQKNNCAPLQCP